MATLTIDKTGNAGVYVLLPDGRRRPVRLGKVGRQRAERIGGHVTALEGARLQGIVPDPAALAWLADVKGTLRARLAACGLCEAVDSSAATLGTTATTWLAMKRKGVKQSTVIRLERSVAKLREYFGDDRMLTTIKPGDCDEWRTWPTATRCTTTLSATN